MLWGIRPPTGVRHAHNNSNDDYLSRITPSVKSSQCYQLGPAGA